MSIMTQIAESSWTLWGAVALSFLAGLVYLVIASPAVPDDYKAPPTPVMIAAGVAYLVGGGLILLADQRLLLLEATLNPLVLTAYVAAVAAGRAAVDGLSVSGKVAQIALEIVLVGLLLWSPDLSG